MVAPVEHFLVPHSSLDNLLHVCSKTEEGHMKGRCLLLMHYTVETFLSIQV